MSEVKQVIVVRKDLNMRKGKIAAQVAHASMKVLLDGMAVSSYERESVFYSRELWTLNMSVNSPMWKWLNGSFTKVVVSVNSLDELLLLQTKANDAGVINAVITDAGRTEFHGEPTITCIVIGPDESDKIDEITGDLPLL